MRSDIPGGMDHVNIAWPDDLPDDYGFNPLDKGREISVPGGGEISSKDWLQQLIDSANRQPTSQKAPSAGHARTEEAVAAAQSVTAQPQCDYNDANDICSTEEEMLGRRKFQVRRNAEVMADAGKVVEGVAVVATPEAEGAIILGTVANNFKRIWRAASGAVDDAGNVVKNFFSRSRKASPVDDAVNKGFANGGAVSTGSVGKTEPIVDLSKVKGSTSDFELYGASPGNAIYGALDTNGIIEFKIRAGKGASIPGYRLFDAMMKHFGDKATGVGGNWTSGSNLEFINKATAGGKMTLEQAMPQTWTGGLSAARYGFTNAKLVDFVGTPGNYTRVNVIYTAPQ